MNRYEYIAFAYLLTGVALAVYYTVHDWRKRCVPDSAILLIPLMPFGWPYTVAVLLWQWWKRWREPQPKYSWIGDGTKDRLIKPETKPRKQKGKT